MSRGGRQGRNKQRIKRVEMTRLERRYYALERKIMLSDGLSRDEASARAKQYLKTRAHADEAQFGFLEHRKARP